MDFMFQYIGDYMRLCILSDVAFLADVLQMFRYNLLDKYQLDPAYYMSALQLTWSALLKFIYRPIYLITDPEMYCMIQPNIRGGMSRLSTIRPCEQQAHGLALRSDQSHVLHNVCGRQQPRWLGKVAAGARQQVRVGEQRRLP